MKKRVSLLIVLTMMVSLTGCNPKKTTMDHYLENVDAKYAYNISKALAEDDDLLSNELGYRSAGSDAEHKAADYIEKEMGKIGLETEKIPVTVDKWQFNSASLKIEGTDIQMMPASYQLSGTSKEGIVAEMVDVGNGTAADYEGKDVEGKIVLAGVDQFNVAWIDMYMEEAALHKAAALVTYDNGGYGTYDDDQINVQDVCCDDLIPTVAISKNNYKSIKKALKAGNNKTTLKIDNDYSLDDGVSYNVVGKIPGKSSKQQIIISGHYDIYFRSFQDDSCAIGLIMAIAKAMKESNYTPENDILFIAHGSEEWGAANTEYDWTTGAWEMINTVHPEWAQKTIAMLNFELPAFYDGASQMEISCVPEYASAVKQFVNEIAIDPEDNIYPKGINDTSVDANTMEDGVSYRHAGVPYFVNVPGTSEGEKGWIQMHYHTKSDNPSTYSREVMTTNINTYGMLAIWLDQAPVMKLDLTAAVDDLNVLNEDIAKKAGIDVSQYNQSLNSLKKATIKVNKKIENINKRFADAKTEKEKDALRKEGRELNLKLHEAFKYIQDHFIGIELSSTITTSFAQYQENIELFNDIIQALEKGNISNDKDGALDLAWHINSGSEYGFYDFSVESNLRAQRRLSEETNPNNVFWTTNRQFKFAKTYPALLGIFEKAEQENPDFADEINIYQEEIKNQEVYLNEEVTQVIQAMNELTNKLLEY